MKMPRTQIADMLFGALVADAASLGLHWIYDVDRIAEITASQDGKCAFTPVDAKNYEDVPSYFAHAGRLNGMLTQYGEVLYLAIRSMNACDGKFDSTSYKESSPLTSKPTPSHRTARKTRQRAFFGRWVPIWRRLNKFGPIAQLKWLLFGQQQRNLCLFHTVS